MITVDSSAAADVSDVGMLAGVTVTPFLVSVAIDALVQISGVVRTVPRILALDGDPADETQATVAALMCRLEQLTDALVHIFDPAWGFTPDEIARQVRSQARAAGAAQ